MKSISKPKMENKRTGFPRLMIGAQTEHIFLVAQKGHIFNMTIVHFNNKSLYPGSRNLGDSYTESELEGYKDFEGEVLLTSE